ncbi:Transcription factor fungi [Macrophomina phaseolina MS6]|uniref:Transcription factor fungi n=1 Tax=Macrophomina phaseolina (strain MS6) TaxID=1126212 RepID=K2RLG8_MACPH|nr:Transcription factor fungi [Macrophomina phaseolina MS6]
MLLLQPLICQSNKTCTYHRLNSDTGSSDLVQSKVPFLLNFTTPVNESTIPAFFLEGAWSGSDETASCTRLFYGSSEDELTGFHSSVLELPALSSYYGHGFGVDETGNHHTNGSFGGLGPPTDHTISWELRTDEILRHIWVTYNEMFRNGVEGCPVFDMDAARAVFSVQNVKQFVSSYFQHVHDEIPVIHRPTFHIDTASPELLLTIVLAGAAFSPPLDDALSTRHFMPIADEFVFGQLARRLQFTQPDDPELRPEDVQNMQAAVIMGTLQSGLNDVQTRRRVKSRRHPQLVSTLRSFGLLSARRRALATWQDFIEDETRVRITIFTFMSDNHYCMFFNQPPLISVSEMVGDLPCAEELWEANTPSQFEHLSAIELQDAPPPPSVRYLVNTLMHGPWTQSPGCPCKNASHFNLYIAIAALQSVTYSARTSCLGPASFQAILRATERWQKLWGSGPPQLGPDPRKHAFMRHAAETCWLVRTVVKVAQSGDMSSGYMQNLSADNFSDLHNFIKKYGHL